MNRIRTDVILDPSTLDALRIYCATTGIARARVVEFVVRQWLGLPTLTPGLKLERPVRT